ncbi:MAG: DNA-directed RNA polymerase subunit beta, partial [Sphaerochaetaceae bacterium]|nr:DNA-directed RNA polymerase subunit beta [Sphaerochaetaceae bacterium]
MGAAGKSIKRTYIGSEFYEVCELPNLIGVQLDSYERFLHYNQSLKNSVMTDNSDSGLEEVFQSIFPIESPNGEMRLVYNDYVIDFQNQKLTESQCKKKGRTYSVPVKATISLELPDGEIREKEIFFGDIPVMTDRGTFIINGAERVVVSQIHRSPGVIFSYEKTDKEIYSSRIIPYRGAWLEFEIDDKKKLIYAKIDRKKRILATLFLRAIGVNTRESIIERFYNINEVELKDDPEVFDYLDSRYLAKDIWVDTVDENGKDSKKLFLTAGSMLNPHEIEELIKVYNITQLSIVDLETEGVLQNPMILNCLENEQNSKFALDENGEPTKEAVLSTIYNVLQPGEMIAVERAEKDLPNLFMSSRRYDLGAVGRYKFNKKFGTDAAEDEEEDTSNTVLTSQDIINTMDYLIKVYSNQDEKKYHIDDIDNLGNRRIRCVGELL